MDIIFDVDGTLLNIEHREHLVRNKPAQWVKFRALAHLDTPNYDIVDIAKALEWNGHRIVIASGRMECERAVTEASLNPLVDYSKLYMRKTNDHRPDNIIKLELLDQMRVDGYDPVLAFDDRQRVVDAFRGAGLRVCQVAPGDF